MSSEGIAAIAGVAGTLGGVVVGGVLTMWRDRVDWDRKLRTRWDDVRRSTYASFLHAAHAVSWEGHIAPYRFKAHLESDPETSHEALADVRAAEDQLWNLFREIELVAGKSVIEAAQQVATNAREIMSAENAVLNHSTPETLTRQSEVHAAYAAAKNRFTSEARAEIGVADPPS